MTRFAINGRFLIQPLTGVQRVARELCRAFARTPAASSFSLLIPPGAEPDAERIGLPYETVGTSAESPLSGALWESWVLPRAAGRRYLLNLGNRAPILPHQGAMVIHDAHVFDLPGTYNPLFRLAYRLFYGQAVRNGLDLVTVSQFSRERLAMALGVDSGHWTVIPNGVDHIRESDADTSILHQSGLTTKNYVLTVGARAPHKNLAALAPLAEGLATRGQLLVMVGDTSPAVYSGVELPHGLKLLGRVGDAGLRALYENARCFVFASRYEGFGLPPLEAMALGCPTAASALPPLRELCGDACLFLDPDNPHEIAERVLTLSDDEAHRRRLSQAGPLATRSLTWDAAAQRWLEFLSRINLSANQPRA